MAVIGSVWVDRSFFGSVYIMSGEIQVNSGWVREDTGRFGWFRMVSGRFGFINYVYVQ